MAERKRKITMKVMVTNNEEKAIQENMSKANIKNFSVYARHMLLNGKVEVNDYTDMRQLAREIGAIGNNINQIAKRANESKSVYETDLLILQKEFMQLKSKISEQLIKSLKK